MIQKLWNSCEYQISAQ